MELTYEYVSRRLRYEPDTGNLYWLPKNGNDRETRRWATLQIAPCSQLDKNSLSIFMKEKAGDEFFSF